MKKLFVLVAATVVLLGMAASSSSADPVYELGGIVVNETVSQLGGYPFGEMTEPPPAELVFVDGFVPTPGGSFTEADVTSVTVWGNPSRTFVLGVYLPGSDETIQGTFSTKDITNGFPEIDLFAWATDIDVINLNADNTLTWETDLLDNPTILTNAIFAAVADAPVVQEYTGIQITGSTSNITANVQAGDTVMFTVTAIAMDGVGPINYRFFTRAGYGEANWGGNTWTLVQDFGTSNSVSVPFNTAGIYFLACHAEQAGEAWAFGDPQTGIVVEVWPAQ